MATQTKVSSGDTNKTATWTVKSGLAQMLNGGVIMDVVTADQAKIAEDAGAVAVMALERVPSDIRKMGGVARMSDPTKIIEIKKPNFVILYYHRVIKDGVMWDCKKDYPFPFPKIFTPILRRAKTVEITDGYLMNDHNDIREKNLEALIELCSSDCNIKVIIFMF